MSAGPQLAFASSAFSQHYPFEAVTSEKDSPFCDLPERDLSPRERLAIDYLEKQIAEQARQAELKAAKAAAPSFFTLLRPKRSNSSSTDEDEKSQSSQSAKQAVEEERRRRIPTAEEFEIARRIPVYDAEGEAVEFGTIMQSRGKTVVIFVRHWWCGLCAQYMDALAQIPKSSYARKHIKVIVIGCGSPELIKAYQKSSGIEKHDIHLFTEPTGRLHASLQLNKSLDPGKAKDKGDYITKSMTKNILDSAKTGLASPVKAPGSQTQLGGEFCFQRLGQRIDCIYASRMTTTRNHGTLKALFTAAGADIRVAQSIINEGI